MLPVAVARSSSEEQCNTLCTSGFVGDVIFSRNAAIGTESKTKRKFASISPGGGTGAKTAVFDCSLLFG